MDARSARIHELCDLDSAAGCTRALQSDLKYYREYVLEILSCDAIHHPVASEKLDVLARNVIPKRVAGIEECIARAREMRTFL
jgi:hypothetical protein